MRTENEDVVTLERFSAILEWFGPFAKGKKLLQNVVSTIKIKYILQTLAVWIFLSVSRLHAWRPHLHESASFLRAAGDSMAMPRQTRWALCSPANLSVRAAWRDRALRSLADPRAFVAHQQQQQELI
jgi:hypothetical protein